MVAQDKKTEALRMAVGLTLLDDQVTVAVLGELDTQDAEIALQLESLEFADVPVIRVDPDAPAEIAQLAAKLRGSDTVFIV